MIRRALQMYRYKFLERFFSAVNKDLSRREDSPHASFFLMLEHIVSARRILERKSMCGEIRRVQFAFRCVVQQTCHVSLAVLLRAAHRQPLVHNDADWELVHYSVDAQDRQRSTLAADHDGLTQRLAAVCFETQRLLHAVVCVPDTGSVSLHSHSIDAGVRTASTGHFLERLDNTVDLCIIDRLCPTLFSRHLQTLRETVDCDHAVSSHKEGA